MADVNKVLTSAAQVAHQGYLIVLDGDGNESYFEDKELGDKFKLYQEDGIYVRYLKVFPYYQYVTEDFTGQPSGSSWSGLPRA